MIDINNNNKDRKAIICDSLKLHGKIEKTKKRRGINLN